MTAVVQPLGAASAIEDLQIHKVRDVVPGK